MQRFLPENHKPVRLVTIKSWLQFFIPVSWPQRLWCCFFFITNTYSPPLLKHVQYCKWDVSENIRHSWYSHISNLVYNLELYIKFLMGIFFFFYRSLCVICAGPSLIVMLTHPSVSGCVRGLCGNIGMHVFFVVVFHVFVVFMTMWTMSLLNKAINQSWDLCAVMERLSSWFWGAYI